MRTPSRLIAVAMLTAVVSPAHSASFEVDPTHTSVVFSISHMGYSYTYGMFRTAEGAVEFDQANPAAGSFKFSIDVATIDTMNRERDQHLLGADFFNATEYPKITFESTSIAPSTGEDGKTVLNVTGKLTLHGETREVTLPVTYLGEGEDHFGSYRIGFLCQATLKRSEFGMGGMIPAIGDKVGVTVSFEGLRK